MLDLTWEKTFAQKGEAAEELLAEIRLTCHREDIPEHARPILNKLLQMKITLDNAQGNAIALENKNEDVQAQEISSVSLQSTSVSYMTSAQNPYSNKAKAAKALAQMQSEYDSLYIKLIHSIRKFPRTKRTAKDVIEFC